MEGPAGEAVTPQTSLGLTAVYRSVSIIAGTIASLPLKSYRTLQDGSRERVTSFLDDPGGPDGPTAYEWKETLVAHLLLHGNAYGLHLYNGAGAIGGLQLLEPSAVEVKRDETQPGRVLYAVTLAGGDKREFTSNDLTHIRAMTVDGFKGLSPISLARTAISTGLAGDKAAARMFRNGMLVGGLVTTDEDMTEEEARTAKEGLDKKLAGTNRAGDIAFVNRNLKFSPWTMNSADAQFIESRGFQVEEIARLFGVPKVLLAEDGASTWGSGIAELLRGMQRFTLAGWTSRIEGRLSRLLSNPRFVEFDYAGLLAPTPSEVTENMAAEIEAGLLTVNEGRKILNREPLPEGPAATDQEVTQ